MTTTGTENDASPPWDTDARSGAKEAVCLVIAWSLDEPDRLGEVAPVEGPLVLGRGAHQERGRGSSPERAVFRRVRPGSDVVRAPLSSARISRDQLEVIPVGNDELRLRCVGRPGLAVNGTEVDTATVRPGDVVRVRNALVLLVEKRPVTFVRRAALDAYPSFAFGAPDLAGIVGESAAAWELRDRLAFAATVERHVLILGESGAGKELAARAVHALSSRHKSRFVSRSASTLPAGLVDAELFGTARGYPNAGSPERPGLVAEAEGGTLFLDEIGELPPDLQARLLRGMDSGGEYQRLGDATVRRSDLRVVAATNQPTSSVKHDVLARFVTRITVSDLNARRADVPLLARLQLAAFAARSPSLAARFFGAGAARIDPRLVELLVRRSYSHHARELEFLLLVALESSTGDYVALTPEVEAAAASGGEATEDAPGAEGGAGGVTLDRATVEATLLACDGSTTRAAKQLGLTSRFALYRLMKRLGIASEPIQH